MAPSSSSVRYVAGSLSLLFILLGCGGGGGGTTPDNPPKPPPDEPPAYSREPYFPYLWHIDSNASVLNGLGYRVDEDADINLRKAWELTRGSGIRVAVIDDGADITHEDLAANIVSVYNVDQDSNESIHPDNPNGTHGTTVSGCIAAPVNGKGIVGIAPDAELIIIRQDTFSDATTIRAFEFAKEQGARVVNCSWGSEHVSDAVVSEIKSLYESGITVVFASGNEGKSLDTPGIDDESEIPWVLGVGASGENNDVTLYSNYGSQIDLLAPGGDAIDSSGLLGLDDMGEQGSLTMQRDLVNLNYAFTEGTSFSAPIVSGVAALMYALDPALTPKEIREILIQTAFKIGGDDAAYDSNGFDEKRAYGKVNAYEALQWVKERKRE